MQLATRSGARATRANGELNGRLQRSVRVPPIEGRANRAVALAAGIPMSRVKLLSGVKSKHKSFVIEIPEEAAVLLAKQLSSIGR